MTYRTMLAISAACTGLYAVVKVAGLPMSWWWIVIPALPILALAVTAAIMGAYQKWGK